MHVANQIIPLVGSNEDGNDAFNWPQGTNLDNVVSYDVNQIGSHHLVCTVEFSDGSASSGSQVFQKFFKFDAKLPIESTSKVEVIGV